MCSHNTVTGRTLITNQDITQSICSSRMAYIRRGSYASACMVLFNRWRARPLMRQSYQTRSSLLLHTQETHEARCGRKQSMSRAYEPNGKTSNDPIEPHSPNGLSISNSGPEDLNMGVGICNYGMLEMAKLK